MLDQFILDPGKGIQSSKGAWYRCVQTLGVGASERDFEQFCAGSRPPVNVQAGWWMI
jgi:hypothetical protein